MTRIKNRQTHFWKCFESCVEKESLHICSTHIPSLIEHDDERKMILSYNGFVILQKYRLIIYNQSNIEERYITEYWRRIWFKLWYFPNFRLIVLFFNKITTHSILQRKYKIGSRRKLKGLIAWRISYRKTMEDVFPLAKIFFNVWTQFSSLNIAFMQETDRRLFMLTSVFSFIFTYSPSSI